MDSPRKSGLREKLTEPELKQLREIVGSLLERNGGAIPHDDLVSLASNVGPRTLLTVDFQATDQIGGPMVIVQMDARHEQDDRLLVLSPREKDVAALIALGLANKEIARKLGIVHSTVKDHVHRILSKTGLPNRAAIAFACHQSGAEPFA